MKKSIFAFIGTMVALFGSVPSFSQNPVIPFRSPRVTFTTQTGNPLTAGCVFTYAGGTTTPQATYADSTGSTANTNPVILDSTGSAVIWLGANTYKFVAYSAGGYHCSSGSVQWTVDNVPGNAFLNGTISGATITNPTITGGTDSGTSISSAAITSSSIDSTPIGSTTPSSGSFTSIASKINAVTFSSTPVFNAASYGYFTMTLTNNVTSSSITGGTNGQLITWNICQNGTGQVVNSQTTGFTFAWPSNYTNPPVVNPTLSACTIVTAYYNGGYWYTVSSNPQLLLGNLQTLTFTSTPTFPASSYSNFYLTISNNVTSSTITGGTVGQIITIDLCQNSTGSYTFVWPTNILNAPTVATSPNSCTSTVAVYNGTNWNTVAVSSPSTSTPLTGIFDRIPYTATPIFNASAYSAFAMTLAGNMTSSSISGGTVGQMIAIVLTQGTSTTSGPASAPTYITASTGGSLPASTAYYAKCAYVYGTAETLPSPEAVETTGSTSTSNTITWSCPVASGVTLYKFYIGTGTGAEAYYFTSTSSTYVQTSIPSTGNGGVPYTSGSFTVTWPSNMVNAPTMNSGTGATTGLVAIYDGTYWQVVGTSGSAIAFTSQTNCLSVACSGGSTYAVSTVYTNSSGRALIEEITDTYYGTCAGSDGSMTAYVNGTPVLSWGITNSCNGTQGGTFVVPPGATFEVVWDQSPGGMTFSVTKWIEVK